MKVIASALNVRSGPGTDFRILGELPKHTLVDGHETHGDWIWIEPGHGWVNKAFLEADRNFVVPVGREGIYSQFGVPGSPRCSAGRADLPAPIRVGWMRNTSITRFACHVDLEKVFEEVFQAIYDSGAWPHLRTFDGCYNFRQVKNGSGKASTHSWGIAIDLNASTNRQGTPGDMSLDIVSIFESYGFKWGGEFKGDAIDPMHFQYATEY